jgi:hypothetical protein
MSSSAQIIAALGLGVGPTVNALNVFNVNDNVWLKTDVEGLGAASKDFRFNENKLTVVGTDMVAADGTGIPAAGDLLDANGDVADGTQAANIATDGVAADTHVQWPFFVWVVAANGKKTLRHESELLSLDGVNHYIALETWV